MNRMIGMKVLILSATTGGGHMTAANAMKNYIIDKDPTAEVLIEDTLEYDSPFLNQSVTGGYVYMAKNTPLLYGSVYNSTDKNTPINKTVEITTTILRNKLYPLIEQFSPDIVITTHPFAAEMVTALKTRGLINLPVINIITDFAVHKAYISDGVDAYIVSSREMVDDIVSRGVNRTKVYPYGIPVKSSFYKQIDREAVFESEGLDPDLPTILIMAGSFGVTDILKIYHKIVKSPEDFQVIVITGKNEKLYETFQRYLNKINIRNTMIEIKQIIHGKPISPEKLIKRKKPVKATKLLYYTTEVEKYMHMADIIVTKPGGLTVSESIAVGLPMAVFKAIPGQEVQNAEFLVKKNMAVKLEKNNTCTAVITDLIKNKEKLESMRKSIKTFSRGNSSEHIYKLMLELIKRSKNG